MQAMQCNILKLFTAKHTYHKCYKQMSYGNVQPFFKYLNYDISENVEWVYQWLTCLKCEVTECGADF